MVLSDQDARPGGVVLYAGKHDALMSIVNVASCHIHCFLGAEMSAISLLGVQLTSSQGTLVMQVPLPAISRVSSGASIE
jgi:hypothetical protein